jgi:two-component system KDP operon response regulator KdpE
MAIDPNGRRVLVAEESEVIRRVLCLILQGEGYRVDLATDGYSALRLAQAHHPDAVALDLGLHDPDGSEVLRRLKEDPATRSIPVVVISAYPERLSELERGYASEIIAKPFDVDDLLVGVGNAVGEPSSRARRVRGLN